MTHRSSTCTFVLIILTDQVGNFKRLNAELQTFKLNKVGSKWKVCPLIPISGGLRQWWCHNCSDKALKVNNLVSLDSATIMQKTIWFLCVHIQRLLNGFLSRIHNTPLKIKRSKNIWKTSKNPNKTLIKPYKYPHQDQEKRAEKKRRGGKKKEKKRREILT